jgi:hypothetical protein
MRFGLPRDNGQPAVGDAGFDEERVSTAALVAAMELLCGMSDHPAATPGDQLLDDIRQAAIGPEELTQAFATLLYGFLHVFNDADLDMVVGSVTRRRRRLQLVPEPMASRMHGAMRATAAGRSPLGWREQMAPRPPWRSPGRAAAGCWLICSTSSAKRAVSATGAATGPSSCWGPSTQNQAAACDLDQQPRTSVAADAKQLVAGAGRHHRPGRPAGRPRR